MEVENPIEGIHKLAETILIEAYCHCIDSEIAAFLVVVECAVFHNRVAALAMIRFLSCADKLQFELPGFHLRCAVGGIYAKALASVETLCHTLSQLYSASDRHEIEIGRGAVEEYIPHITAYHIYFAAHLIGRLSNLPEHRQF